MALEKTICEFQNYRKSVKEYETWLGRAWHRSKHNQDSTKHS